jgi:molybdopterin-containing oxidoreductase family iron-sulfur binding subunit
MDAISRRRFLSLLSASAALAAGASCSKIDRGTIVPYTRRPGDIIPGVAAYYASTFQEGLATHGVLVKTREGRPIHIEGNTEHAVSRGKTNLRAIGDLLGLYDPDRLRSPVHKGAPAKWDEAEKALTRTLSDARLANKPVLLLTGAIASPTQKALIESLKAALPALLHAEWEPVAPLPEIGAMKALYGKAVSSKPHLDRADVILSLQADFLGAETNAPVFVQDFAARRAISSPSDNMNRLWVLEGGMSLTGSNADQRLQVRPSKIAGVAFAVAQLLHELHSVALPAGIKAEDLKAFNPETLARSLGVDPSILRLLAADLARARKVALVLAGPALPPEAHIACHLLNLMLEAEGNTLDLNAAPERPGLLSFAELGGILKDAARGRFAAGIFWDANPAYAFPDASVWENTIARIPETYRLGLYEDETALDCSWRLPEHHWLEAWGDFESSPEYISLRQPAIAPIHETRQAGEFLLLCMRNMKIEVPPSYLEYMKARWRAEVYPAASPASFDAFWNAALHDGGVKRDPMKQPPLAMNIDPIKNALASAATYEPANAPAEIELILSPGAGVYDGRYANNGWLNELPDPVTKATWGNPILLSISDAEKMGFKDGDIASMSAGSGAVEAPVLIQPGQSSGVAGLALGYGRRTGNVAVGVGSNAFALIDVSSNAPYFIQSIKISGKDGKERRPIPRTQEHNRMEGRDLARSWALPEYAGRLKNKNLETHPAASLMPDRKFPEHKWSMVVDLSACVGCSACVIACQSENNIPVVGPERVLAGRHMHWMRIDRYYEGDPKNPSVLHQPMFCQHCDNAPCEIVCPVNATTHSPDGLNQMAYNRCVGTRYCSNNCPFKVRRFNFFDYTSMKKEPEILAHNPEVTVRPRGVMEKCTFCIQRIQNAKQKAKIEGRPIADGEIQPACAAACPAGAIVFGDLNNAVSRVAILSKTNRQYRMLEELGIKPSVTYLADISNPAAEKGKA